MELKIKPSKYNQFPWGGFLINSPEVKKWVLEIQSLGFSLSNCIIFPIPSNKANELWGCLVLTNVELDSKIVGKNELCQQVFPNLFIPEKTTLTPTLSLNDRTALFKDSSVYIFHPTFGIIELESFDLIDVIEASEEKFRYVFEPEDSVFLPQEIKSFTVEPIPEEEILEKLELKEIKPQKLPNEKLNTGEKIKYNLLKGLFKKNKKNKSVSEPTGLMRGLGSLLDKLFPNSKYSDSLQQDFDSLHDRKQDELVKLLDMLEKNPDEALKYAIPLDDNNSSRGDTIGGFSLFKQWSIFSLFGSPGSDNSGGKSFDFGDKGFESLQNQYYLMAKQFINKGEYEKAAYVYLKLLKNKQAAAETLKDGKLYQEAATVYLKHLGDKENAAACYEQGKFTNKAIDLYQELENYIKVGDLYLTLNNRKDADMFYQKNVDQLLQGNHYFKAANVYQNKMKRLSQAQDTLLDGWSNIMEQEKCLSMYFNNIKGIKQLKKEYDFIYSQKLIDSNSRIFLKVLQKDFNKNDEMKEFLREMGYKIIANQIDKDAEIKNFITTLNPTDLECRKDVLRYRHNKKR